MKNRKQRGAENRKLMPDYVSVGKILNFHGIKGEVKVGFSQSQRDFIADLDAVFLCIDHDYVEFKIQSVRFNKNFAIIKFKGLDDINDVVGYKGYLLFTDKSTIRESLGDDEFLIDELTGLNVYDTDGCHIGFVIGVSNNGATDLLSVKTKSGKISLVPFVNALVPTVDIKNKKIIINKIEGLIEL